MKWTNKGHEFDGIGENFIGKDIYIYYANSQGAWLFNNIAFLGSVKGFIDKNERKQSSGFCGLPVISSAKLLELERDNNIVIVAENTEVDHPYGALNQLLRCGYKLGMNLFPMNIFLDFYLPIYSLYACNKLFYNSIMCFMTTTVCNLKCKACLVFTLHNKNMKHKTFEEAKKDLDLYFSCIDYTREFNLSGGEPLLNHKTQDICHYIGKNYRDKVDILSVVTNGTIVPSDEICKIWGKYNYHIVIDDYFDAVNNPNGKLAVENKSRVPEIISILEQYKVNYEIRKNKYWIDLKPETTDNSHFTEEQLINYFMVCNNNFSVFEDGKFYSCNYSKYAIAANLCEELPGETYMVYETTLDIKKELLEFLMKYSLNGYAGLCKKCAGFISISNNYDVPAAQQVHRN